MVRCEKKEAHMSTPSRDTLMAESQEAFANARKVWNRRHQATEAELRHAKDWLNKTTDALQTETHVAHPVQMAKNYKAALARFIHTHFEKAQKKTAEV
jgi:hypothetical protein